MRADSGVLSGRFATAGQTFLSGEGAMDELVAALPADEYSRVLLLASPTAASTTGFGRLRELLGECIAGTHTEVGGHAPIPDTERLAEIYRDTGLDAIIAYGGGSVSDTAKGLSIVLAEGGRLEDHCSVFTPPDRLEHRNLTRPKVPVFAVPTTLSAAEVTPGGGATTASGIKRVFWDPKVAARIVCLDPDVIATTPASVLATTGANALAHCAEGMYSKTATMLSTALATEATRLLASGLAHIAGVEPDARDPAELVGLLTGAAMSGIVISNARVCLHHAICHVLGAKAGVAHGDANSVMLPHAMRFNLPDTQAEQQQFVASLVRGAAGHPGFDQLGGADSDEPPALVARFLTASGVPRRLRDVGVSKEELPGLARDVMQDRGLYFNPRRIDDPDTITTVLNLAW